MRRLAVANEPNIFTPIHQVSLMLHARIDVHDNDDDDNDNT